MRSSFYPDTCGRGIKSHIPWKLITRGFSHSQNYRPALKVNNLQRATICNEWMAITMLGIPEISAEGDGLMVMDLDELVVNDVVGWSTKVTMTIGMTVLIIMIIEFSSIENL